MTISSIVDIVDGKLLYKPYVSYIYNIRINIDNIIQGDLFIAKKKEDIQRAIDKDCFAIIYDFDININDIQNNEIAFNKVENIIKSIFRIIRFKLITLNIKTYLCNDIQLELLNIFIKKNNINIKLISNDIYNNIEIFNNIDNIKYIFCTNKYILDNIYPIYETFNTKIYTIENIINNSIFQTTFTYKNQYFYKLKLSKIYINYFLAIYDFLNRIFDNNIDLNKLKDFSYFKPIFINKYFKEITHENSDKFILHNENIQIAFKEIAYLTENYKYAKKYIFIKNTLNIKKTNHIKYFIKDIKEIQNILENKEYNSIYIIGFNKNKIKDFVIQKDNIKSIFDI